MSSHATSQFPDPFDRVEFRAVRRHELQGHMPLTLSPAIRDVSGHGDI